MRTSINRRNRTACSILALATALAVGPSPAAAQSFQYQPNPTVLGSAVITNPDASTTQIVVNNPQTVITWTPTDTATSTSPIVFQPGGTTANFVGGSNFAVLNRIIATDQTRQIQFFGTVNSYIGAVGGNTGGSIYFYAPGGFLLGGGSVFNVGSLVLSASPILHDANGTFITGARNEVTFGQATQLGATITTNPGSQINALGNPSANTFSNSYVAFVAPRIIRGGDIAVNGQAAMVAADAATIRFAPDGLFDIEVTSGTAQANGITGGGDITGPASSGSGDNHRVYMVAVPKNQALSLALSQGSDLGFNIANAADVVGNAIVLSAGHDIVNGQVQSARSAGGGTGAASIIANAVNATSAVTAQATGNGQFFSSAGQSSNFASNLTLIAPEFAWASASGSDASFNVVGDITLNSDVFGSVEGASATGGWASLYAQNGGFVSIGGNATLSANGFGAGSSGNGVSAGSGTGGRAWIQAEPGSSMFITGAANATADGYGGFASGAGAAGGTGTGGEALIRAFGAGSSLGIDGNATASAHGYGGGAFNGDGGLGSGGDAGIYADIGSLTVDGSLLAITSAYGGDGGGAGNSSGDGVGGDSYVYANAGGALTVAGQLQVASHAFGGVDTSGLAASGAGLAGNSTLYAFGGGDVSSGSMASVQANGYGGPFGECIGCGGAAAIGRGGSAEISTSGAGSTLTLAGVSIAANGTGSNGVVDQGGDGYGGYAEMWANSGGSITVNGSASLTATGTGGADFGGFGGGDGFGGGYLGDGYAQIATYGTDNATSITVTGSTLLQANGNGGAATQVAGAAGGNGRAGVASVTSNIGSIALNSVSVSAVGNGGNSNAGTGGSGTGGEAYLFASGGNLTVSTTALVSTGGSGGSGGTGGAGTGGGNLAGQFGGAGLFASGAGLLTINGAATVQALGTGGVGTAAGGAALGGVAQANAFSGGDIDLLGLTRISSDATAGAGADGRGGVSIARATSGSTIDFNQLNLRADGRGGNDAGLGAGDGYGGTATLEANGPNASVTLANTLTSGNLQDIETLSADGFGGNTALAGGTGGTGIGGTVNLRSTAGGVVTLAASAGASNPLYFRARGYGGDPNAEGATGGLGDGGTLSLVVDGGSMTLGTSQYSSIGEGGFTTLAGLNTNGGEGLGGERHITVLNGGTLTAAFPGGVSGGVGGFGTGTGNGGNGSGGLATLTVDNSTLNITGNTIVTSQVAGGAAESGNGGNALGGNSTFVNITNGSTVNIASGATLGISANSFGGGATAGSGNGGNAIGGTTTVNITGSSILGGTVTAGSGGSGGSSVGGTGGNGTAGTAVVNLNGATINGMAFTMGSNGFGGSGLNGGNGIGGTAVLNSFGAASSVTTTGLISIQAGGLGASSTGSGNGGNGTAAGAAQIFASGGTTLTLNGNVEIDSGASGGAGGANGGNGGNADGGMAEIYANNATINLNGNASHSADAAAGNSPVGAGGHAFGGTARIGTDAGLVAISGTLSLNGSATGGNGAIGGDAVAIVSTIDEEVPVAASIYAGNNGAVIVGGATAINASATGGNGSNGNGGTATAGEVDIVAYVGDITLAALTLNANGTGGNGGLGGNGGIGNGGFVDIAFGLGSAPVDGTIVIADATITANGIGGAGGAGTDANTGGNGGAGGAGNGGGIAFVGSAAGGSLQGGNITLSATATGGAGGAGGNGDSGTGGNGGAGGAAIAGFIQSGTISAQNSLGNGGDFDVGNLSVNTSAFGGNGGNGGSGGAGNGTGGNGGNAAGGRSDFLIRGVAGSADAVILQASATGGNGGSGSTAGNGGNATTGTVAAESKDRFGHPTQRGSLVADSITATAIATGGSGAITGTETISGGSNFRVLNGDATIGSVSFTIDGNIYDATFGSDFVSVRDGTANIGSLSYVTTGGLTLDASNGSMDATSITLNAATFLASNPTTLPAPTVVGTYSADSFSITTGGNFITNANLDSLNALSISAPGQILAANIVGASNVTLGAGGLIVAGNVTAGGSLTAQTTGAMSLGNLSSGTDLLAQSTGALSVGAVTAGGSANLNSGTSLVAGNVTAGADIHSRVSGASSFGALSAGTDVNIGATGALSFVSAVADETVRMGSDTSIAGGTVTAGDSIVATAGGNIQLGALSAGLVNPSTAEGALYEVALVTSGSISTGTINAAGDVQLAATGGITTDDVTTTERMFAVSPGAIVLGDVTTGGYLLIGGTGLFAFTGSLDIDGGGFDARPTFANFGGPGAASVTTGALDTGRIEIGASGDITTGAVDSTFSTRMISSGGDVLVNGDINAAAFISLLGATVNTGALTSLSNIFISSPGAVTTGSIDSGLWVGVTGGSIDVSGTIDAVTYVNLSASGDINVSGTVDAGTDVDMTASGASSTIDVANIIAGGNVLLNAATIVAGDVNATGFISLFAGGPATITVGDLTGDGVYASSLGNVTTGDIVSTDAVAIESVAGAIATGNITAATTVDLDAAGNISFANVSADDFNFDSGGAVQGGSIVATTHADGDAAGAIVLGDVTVSGPPVEGDFSVGFTSATSIQVGNVNAFDKVGFATLGNLTTGNINAGSLIMALVSGDIVTGALTTASDGQIYIADSSMFEIGGGDEDFDETIVLALDPIATGGSLAINGAIDTPVFRAAIGDAFAIGDISVEGGFAVTASSITTGDITATAFIDLAATGALVTGDLFAGTSVTLSGASVMTGNIVAGQGQPVVLQGFTTMDVGPGNSVEIFSDSSIVTGNITTDGYVGLYAADDITAGSITAEHDVIALAGGDASFGPITTPERFILAGYGNFDQLSDGETFDPELIFSLFPVESTGGNATFAGNSSVGDSFQAFAGGNVVLTSLTSTSEFGGFIGIDAGGTIGISGTVNGGYIDLVSRDINIGSQAQITASLGITFNSTNPDGTFIGDNLSGTNGYRLSQAELNRVDSPFYGFDVLTGRGAAPMMMIGDLALDLSGGEDDEGADFEIESDELGEIDELVGIIRIVGNVSLTSNTDKTVYFTAKTVALDAATGSLSLTNGSGGLNGLIEFEANNIFVASGAIIDKLIQNPRYAGHVEELNAPAAVQRPEGVLRAGAIDFNDEAALENLLIQNTGTASTPAGFVVLSESAYYDGEDGGDEEGDFPAPGSINLVINGQIVTPTGNLTGVAVRDALVEEYGSTEPFTSNSTINGCPVSGGSCGGPTNGGDVVPPAAVVTPTQVAILTSDPLGESVFGNEGDIAGDSGSEGSEGEDGAASSPIDAPQPLFDTRPLNSDEDVNEPVSGAGNPSLYGISSDEDDAGDEDDEEEKKKKKNKGEVQPASQPNARTGDGQ